MKKIDKKSIFFFFSIILISITSFYLGTINSFYNQDFHHWSYVLSSFFDYQNNLKLFKEIIITHGFGQIIFFSLIDNFKKIDLVSIGIVTSFIYSINFIILYKIFSIMSSRSISIALVLIIFLIHPFAILPWADYLSGLCINIFIYLFLKFNHEKLHSTIILSSLLVLSVVFRSTYIISIFSAIFFYLILNFIFIKKKTFNKIFYIFFLQVIFFFLILKYLDNLTLWFSQSILFIKYLANNTSHSLLKERIISNYNLDVWIFLKLIYLSLRSFLSLFNIFNLNNIIFLIFFLLNIKIVFDIKNNFYNQNILTNKIFFISLLGLFGFIQSLHSYEVFRNINATMGIFVTGLYFIKEKFLRNYYEKNFIKIIFIAFIFVYIFLLAIQFSRNLKAMNYEKLDADNYITLNNSFFGKKKVRINAAEHYINLQKILCQKDYKIINFSPDFAITYLCDDKKSSLPYVGIMSNNIKKDHERIFVDGIIYKNEIIVTSSRMNTSNNKQITLIAELHTGHDLSKWFLPRLLYIYKSNS